jgi:pyruvate-formate lyase-activating enzyme
VLSLYIPEVVGCHQLEMIARHLAAVDTAIPFTILAFFPEYRMGGYRSPTVTEMIAAYDKVKASGLQNVRLGNLGVFVKTEADHRLLTRHVAPRDR